MSENGTNRNAGERGIGGIFPQAVSRRHDLEILCLVELHGEMATFTDPLLVIQLGPEHIRSSHYI